MTPVGVAMIVGGITTLIVFRGALFGRTGKGTGEARRRGGQAVGAVAAARSTGRTGRRAASAGAGAAHADDAAAGARAAAGPEATADPAADPAEAAPVRVRRRLRADRDMDAPAARRDPAPGSDAEAGSSPSPASGDAGEADPAPGSAPGSRRFWPTSAALAPASDAAHRTAGEPDRPFAPEFTEADADPLSGPLPIVSDEAYLPLDGAAAPYELRQEGTEMPFGTQWPEVGTPIVDSLGGDGAEAEGLAGLGRGRSMLQRFAALEDIDAPSSRRFDLVTAGSAGADLLPVDDLRAATERGGDPELDIEPELDRVVDDEPVSHSLELGQYDLAGGFLTGHFPVPADLAAGLPDERDGGWAASPDEPEHSADFDAVDATGAPDAFAFAAPPVAEPLPWGGRVEGWSRPEYDDQPEPISGEYWMPVPVGTYDAEYGWPAPAEGQEPPAADGPELPPWPPERPDDRVEAPRTAGERGAIELLDSAPAAPGDLESTGRFLLNTERHGVELLDDNGRRDESEWRAPASAPVNQSLDEPIWSVSDVHRSHMPDLSWAPGPDESAPRRFRRPVASATMRRRRPGGIPASETLTQMLPAVDGYSEGNRSRPRPRPRPGNGQTSTVYVSRHAAEPN
ncbi:hypothetical protein ACIBSW_04030 [Actinoplanes sp. NPDC049668]|uniref:hypothetical protein n=1 Tax=unclassified Actinoplanes TaxID=2626549 RepID=UPI0033A374AA